MGTRHLTVVVSKKKYKVAQYGQWDGYLSGQGVTIAKFISEKMDLKKFRKALEKTKFLTSEQLKQKWVDAGADPSSEWVTSDVSNKFRQMYPQLSRDAGAEVLEMIQNKGATELTNELEFAADSLFCEFAYVLDLDKRVLEIYKGFNKSPLSKKERFHSLKSGTDGYTPVKLLKKIPFNKVNKKLMLKLEKQLNKESEEND